jgi:3-hydroxyacyl-[acyl-carrier-protein] dehydratase
MLFLENLFTVLSYSENCSTVLLSDDTHPVFQAHFESNPILPGFLHIDIIAALFGIEVVGIKKAKYFEIVRPLDKLQIKLLKKQGSLMSFEITKEDTAIVSKIELVTGL